MAWSPEKVLIGLVAGWVSVALHGVGFVTLLAGLDDVVLDDSVELTFYDVKEEHSISVAPDGADAVEPPAIEQERAPMQPSEGADVTASGADGATPARRGFRARLRALEEAHAARERAMARGIAAVRATLPGIALEDAPIARCSGRDRATAIDRVPVRFLGRLSSVLPKGVLPLEYIERTGELGRRRQGNVWIVELALPTGLVGVPFDEPAENVVVLGRDDVRCAIEVEVSRTLFPMRMRGLPVRFVVGDRWVASAVVDIEITDDATIRVLSSSGDDVPFVTGSLARREKVSQTLQDHASSFSAFVALAELLGSD